MATIEGDKYDKDSGNLRPATEVERQNIQSIFQLKEKRKEIQREIESRCLMLPHTALVCPIILPDGGYAYYTVKRIEPKMMHVPITKVDMHKNKTTKADKEAFGIGDL